MCGDKMKYKDYEQQLMTALTVYKIPKSNLDVLQGSFLTTLGLLTGVMLVSYLFGLIPVEELGGLLTMTIDLILFLLGIFFLVPFSIKVIRLSLVLPDNSGFIDSIGSATGLMVLRFLGLLVMFSIIALLPYFMAGLLEESGSNSNILVTFKYVLFIAGMVAILFLVARVIGVIIATVAGRQVSFAEMFRKSQGHVLSILMIMFIALVPLEVIAMFIIYSLSGLLKLSSSYGVELFVCLVESVVRSSIFLLQIYMLWTALTQYMKTNKLLA